MMMMPFFSNRNNQANSSTLLLHQHGGVKPWLLVGASSTIVSVKPTDAVQRWLLPYADFLTVLFCITLLWCGLSLKQAHWLQIQNNKLQQALEQATQQVAEANQVVENQAVIITKLQASVANTKPTNVTASKIAFVSPVSVKNVTPLLKGAGLTANPTPKSP